MKGSIKQIGYSTLDKIDLEKLASEIRQTDKLIEHKEDEIADLKRRRDQLQGALKSYCKREAQRLRMLILSD
jgi:hypothetical protein